VIVFDIPPVQFSPLNPQRRLNPGPSMNMGMMPDFMNPMPHMPVIPQFTIPQFEPYRNFENQFPPPVYRTTQNDLNYEENLVVDMKSLE
jgi:hypothetical protein